MRPTPLALCAALMRQSYLPFKIRIRQWGHLPVRRGPTVLITNHQHQEEGETVVARTILRTPWQTVVTVNSRRMFERGFFAARMRWTASFTRTLNPSRLFFAMGIYPIENQLFSRPIISIAEELSDQHGELAVDDIFRPETLTPLGLASRRTSELWTPALFDAAQTNVKLSHLREPYRHEVLKNFRTNRQADIDRIVDCVRRGATFYVTPEGDYSRDGKLHPLRNGFTDALAPIATLWINPIAYDPFRGRRLSMLYRQLRPADPNDLDNSLAAARAITTSALLAVFLAQRTEPFRADDALAAVRGQLTALPAGVFVDAEVLADPAAVVNEALAVLMTRGTLTRDADGYRLTAQRADPRFPHVADMIAFQVNMLEETLAAARSLAARLSQPNRPVT